MRLTRTPRPFRASLSAALVLAVIVGAPGLAPYQAAAQVVVAADAAGPRVAAPAPLAGGAANSLPPTALSGASRIQLFLQTPSPSFAPAPPAALLAPAPSAAAASPDALTAPSAAAAAPPALVAAAAAPSAEEPPPAPPSGSLDAPSSLPGTKPGAEPARTENAARAALAEAATDLDSAREPAQAASRLNALFSGLRQRRAALSARRPAVFTAARLGAAILSPLRSLRDAGRAVRRMNAGDPNYREFMAPHRDALWKARIMHALDVPITLFTAWGIGRLIDIADKGHQVPGVLAPFIALSAGLVVTVLVELVNDLAYMLKTHYTTYDFVKLLRADLFRRQFRFPQKYFDKEENDPEAIANRISEDVHHASTKSLEIPIRTPVHVLSIVGGLGMLAWTGWTSLSAGTLSPVLAAVIGGALAFVMIGYGLLSARSGRKLEALEEDYQNQRAAMVAHAQQALSSREVYLAMGLEDQAIALFDKEAEALSVLGKATTRVEARFHFAERILGLLTTDLLVTFAIAWSLFLLGVPSVGLITAITRYADSIAEGAEGLATDNTEYKVAEGGTKKIDEMRRLPLDLDAPDAVPLGPLKGRIEFRDVSFRYGDGTPALRNVSFVVEPGESVALVGASGAGKSTILKLISRLYRPDEGQVLVDGVDIATIKIRSLRDQLAIVPQESGLFDASVERNLRAAKPGATTGEMEAALRAAGALDFILNKSAEPRKDLAKGLASNVNEFSGGQKQRIAIARALLRNSSLLLLDEWASALDQENEKKISGVLNTLRQGRTTILVDHKLHFDKKKTKVILLEDGRVVATGLHRDLLKSSPIYAAVVKAARENLED